MVIHCKTKFEDTIDNYSDYTKYFERFPYELSDFQKWSLYAIVNGHHNLITSHTGSGKTLPAEFAIEYFKERNKKVIYLKRKKNILSLLTQDMEAKTLVQLVN